MMNDLNKQEPTAWVQISLVGGFKKLRWWNSQQSIKFGFFFSTSGNQAMMIDSWKGESQPQQFTKEKRKATTPTNTSTKLSFKHNMLLIMLIAYLATYRLEKVASLLRVLLGIVNILTFICQCRGSVNEVQNWQRATAVNICRHLRTFVAVCWHLLGPSSVSFRSGADSGAAAAEKRTSFFLTQSSQIRKIFGIFKWHLFWFPMTSNAISQNICK